MCFYHDYDWYPEVYGSNEELVANEEHICEECRCKIKIGEVYSYKYGQQYELCQLCEEGDCECGHDPNDCDWQCKCEIPNYGESYEYFCCQECTKFLKAIELVEVEAGCPPSESQPAIGMMIEDIGDGDRRDTKRYFKRALVEFPELKTSGYLGQLAKHFW